MAVEFSHMLWGHYVKDIQEVWVLHHSNSRCFSEIATFRTGLWNSHSGSGREFLAKTCLRQSIAFVQLEL